MTITEITAITKSRYRVVLEEGISFIIYKGELQRFHLQRGDDMPEDVYQQIIHEILPKRAKMRCLHLLKSRDYTQKQLEDKLKQGNYPKEVIEEAIAYTASYGYIDDERYTQNFIEYHMQSKSRKRIESDLMGKGIDKKLIERVFEKLGEAGTEIDESAMIQKILLKKKYPGKTASDAEKRKMYGFLYRRGFHTDTINRALLLDITLF